MGRGRDIDRPCHAHHFPWRRRHGARSIVAYGPTSRAQASKQAGCLAGRRRGMTEGLWQWGCRPLAGEGSTVDPGRAEGRVREYEGEIGRADGRVRGSETARGPVDQQRQRRTVERVARQRRTRPHGRQAIHRHSRAYGERRTREGKNPVLLRWRR